jgi:SAM-dependent methyltransferase
MSYNEFFYKDQMSGSLRSAFEVAKILGQYHTPTSLLDVGCGVGTWLKAFKETFPTVDFFGVDGAYVKEKDLVIPKEQFKGIDISETFDLGRKFDLILSLEVGEHIDQRKAGSFVNNICRHGDFVLFSAAIPGQGGTFHVNEQPPEYWADLFEQNGFVCVDFMRPLIWENKQIEYWYRQNMLVFIKPERLMQMSFMEQASNSTRKNWLYKPHPELMNYKTRLVKQLLNPIGWTGYHWYKIKRKVLGAND